MGSRCTCFVPPETCDTGRKRFQASPQCSRPWPTFSKSGSTSRAAAFSRSLSSLQTGSTASGIGGPSNGLDSAHFIMAKAYEGGRPVSGLNATLILAQLQAGCTFKLGGFWDTDYQMLLLLCGAYQHNRKPWRDASCLGFRSLGEAGGPQAGRTR